MDCGEDGHDRTEDPCRDRGDAARRAASWRACSRPRAAAAGGRREPARARCARARDDQRRPAPRAATSTTTPRSARAPFGKVICTSVNDAVLHGLPHDYRLRDGDLLSLDFAASVNGWVADSAISIVVGTPRDEDLRLIDTTQRALDAGIAAARVGNRIGDISRAIGDVAKAGGYSVNTDFGGHGVGRTMHGDPHVPNNGRPGRGLPLKAGPRHRDRAVVPRDDRPHLHRPRRLDPAQRRRLARRALRAHDRDHRRRPDRAHAARLSASASA